MKFNLEELKVQSFVTSLPDEQKKAVKGGGFSEDSCASRYIKCPWTGGCDCSLPCTEGPDYC